MGEWNSPKVGGAKLMESGVEGQLKDSTERRSALIYGLWQKERKKKGKENPMTIAAGNGQRVEAERISLKKENEGNY